MSFSQIPAYLKEEIHPCDSMELACRKLIVDLMEQIHDREEGTKSGEDIEDLHRMRVATRKLRCVLRTFRFVFGKHQVKPVQDQLKFVADVLGEVRDIDTFVVFLREVREKVTSSLQTTIDLLIENRIHRREEGLRRVRELLNSRDYIQWKNNLYQRLADQRFQGCEPTPVREMIPGIITTAYNVVISYRHKVENVSASWLHEIRIQNKRFRYLCEFFQACYDERMQEIIDRHIQLQRFLGVIQDLNRDIGFIQNHFDSLLSNYRQEFKNDPLNDFLDYMKIQEKEARSQFLEFWRGFSLPEAEAHTRYVIHWAIK